MSRALLWWYAGIAAILLAAGVASADSSPPAGIKSVPAITVIEVAEPFPDYVFLESHVSQPLDRDYRRNTLRTSEAEQPRPFSPLAEIDLAPGKPARFQGGRGTQYELFAVPRAALDRYPDREALFNAHLNALREQKVSGIAWHLCQPTEAVRFGDPRSDVVLRYRVDRTPAGDGVVFTSLGEDRSGRYDADAGTTAREWMARWAGAGVAAAAAVVGLGLWWVRRKRAGGSPPAAG